MTVSWLPGYAFPGCLVNAYLGGFDYASPAGCLGYGYPGCLAHANPGCLGYAYSGFQCDAFLLP